MKTKEALEKRRSIRNYKEEEPPKELIEDIINCGRLSPSAKNRQPWYFVIVKGNIKNQIANLMIKYTMNIDETINNKLANYPSSIGNTANIIKQAPILVLIFREKDNNWIIGDNLSIGACIENMCLRAPDLGLGSLWIRDICYVAEDVAKMLKHCDMELNCALAIGYANESPKPRPRKKLDDIMEWYDK